MGLPGPWCAEVVRREMGIFAANVGRRTATTGRIDGKGVDGCVLRSVTNWVSRLLTR